MQEKWIYNKPTFDSFARHYKSGKVAPASLYDKVKGLETYRKGACTHTGVASMLVAMTAAGCTTLAQRLTMLLAAAA